MRWGALVAAGLCVAVLLVALPAYAGTPIAGSPADGVTPYAPKTYAACPPKTTTDQIYTRGATSKQTLKGRVLVQYVVGSSRILIKKYSIDQTGDLNLTVSYPPVSEWKSNEIH